MVILYCPQPALKSTFRIKNYRQKSMINLPYNGADKNNALEITVRTAAGLKLYVVGSGRMASETKT